MNDNKHADLIRSVEGMESVISSILEEMRIQEERENKMNSLLSEGDLDIDLVIDNLEKLTNIKSILLSAASRFGKEYDGGIGGLTPKSGFVYLCYLYQDHYFVWFDLGHTTEISIYNSEKRLVFQS
jgi:hypothetical protein